MPLENRNIGGATATASFLRGRFRRIDDRHYLNFMRRSYPINEQWSVFSYYRRYGLGEGKRLPLNLAEYYAVMRLAFGESGQLYDNWKGAFAFPFEVEIARNGNFYPYALKVVNWRSTVELRFYKITSNPVGGMRVYKQPIEEEFSGNEMETFDAYLYGYLRGLSLAAKSLHIPSFYSVVESNLIAYGHIDEAYFERHFEEPEDFDKACTLYRSKIVSNVAKTWPEPWNRGWIDFEIEVSGVASKFEKA